MKSLKFISFTSYQKKNSFGKIIFLNFIFHIYFQQEQHIKNSNQIFNIYLLQLNNQNIIFKHLQF